MAIPKKIVVLGGGSAGWMAASLLHHSWASKGVEITLIESDMIGVVGVGEGSTPSLKYFFEKLQIAENEWMPFCNATYKCGISFPNWTSHLEENEYFHPFYSDHDWKTGQAFIHNCNVRRQGYDIQTRPNHYWLQAKLAKNNLSPKLKKPQNKELDYGYHFDSQKLGEFLKNRAIKLGIKHIIGTVDVVNNDNKGVQSLTLSCGKTINGDLFIDATGFASLLLQKTLKVPFISYEDYLLNDSAIAIPTETLTDDDISPQTVSRALSAGWAWTIPLRNRNGNGYVYSSKYISPEDAEAELRAYLGISERDDIKARHIKMRLGRVAKHWHLNVLGVGLSQGFIEPLEATALSCIQYTVEHFIETIETGADITTLQEPFNQQINTVYDAIRDYISAHYRLNTRDDSAYWRDNRAAESPEKLSKILMSWDDPSSQFESTLQKLNAEVMYFSPSWYCLLAGKGRFTQSAHALPQSVKTANVADIDNYCEQQSTHFKPHSHALNSD
ncbi:tryptophan halogenase family protein [Pseudoalteromonas sp. G4]|uniref:tryptophan halogenase family protein n=1 Tax=Pseudoalteromonas sp. G4 TaxID=2992761 RepID=UPI00237D8162|nr:tryptophan halogenase family protein [Pseudoalteromonas sp. G4]MDE3272152.1 tryptophan 7-halogenase [Pseudoalteromonas sp. G4]